MRISVFESCQAHIFPITDNPHNEDDRLNRLYTPMHGDVCGTKLCLENKTVKGCWMYEHEYRPRYFKPR